MTTKKPVDLSEIFNALSSLEQEEGVPRSVKMKMESIKTILNNNAEELSVKLSRCFAELDDMSEDVNIPSFIKTHIWHISGLLEKQNRQ